MKYKMTAAAKEIFKSTLPAHVAFALETLDRGEQNLARPKRSKALHLLGRAAARKALAELGVPADAEIARGERGEPLWPNGVVGSISHTGVFACAAVAPSNYLKGIGIDLELLERTISPEVARRVCVEPELQFLQAADNQQEQERLLLRIFSAKESIFKLLYPLCKKVFWFQDVELQPIAQQLTDFDAVLLQSLSQEFPKGTRLQLTCIEQDSLLLSYAVIQQRLDATK